MLDCQVEIDIAFAWIEAVYRETEAGRSRILYLIDDVQMKGGISERDNLKFSGPGIEFYLPNSPWLSESVVPRSDDFSIRR